MRPKLRQFSQIISLFSLSLVLIIVFQNCAGQKSEYNSLYDRSAPLGCVGITCSADLHLAELVIANEQPLRVYKPLSGVPSATCDSTSCIDISGYCDTAGYLDSEITYQWKLNGAILTPALPSTKMPKCDATGRFRIQARVPAGFNYAQMYSVVVTMKVIDASDVRYENPIGTHRREITVASQN